MKQQLVKRGLFLQNRDTCSQSYDNYERTFDLEKCHNTPIIFFTVEISKKLHDTQDIKKLVKYNYWEEGLEMRERK